MNKLRRYPFLHTFNQVQKINATTIGERLSRKPHKLFQSHRTDFYMIFLFTKGEGLHSVDFNTIKVKPRHILFIGSGQVHHFDPKETYDGMTVVFTEDFFSRTDEHRRFLSLSPLFNDPLQPAYFDVGERYNELSVLYDFIVNELKRPAHPNQGVILHHYLFNMMLIAEIVCTPKQKTMPLSRQQLLVADFKRLSNQHLKEQWTINQYAAMLNVTPRSLQNAFSALEDSSPKSWLTERLALEIKRMLTFETCSINEIAFQTGFKEASNFVKFFKAHTGTTPSRFRELLPG
ncbi:MAG: helix-turn-helix domain-containing protein [Niabella sp.]|nr:helix-turn-helix domain-containing protein [Niabella sp.]